MRSLFAGEAERRLVVEGDKIVPGEQLSPAEHEPNIEDRLTKGIPIVGLARHYWIAHILRCPPLK